MSEKIQIGLFERLSLRNWYRYLLYVSGILLILVIFIDAKIDRSKIMDFSMWTIGLSISVWISDTILDTIHRYYEAERTVHDRESVSEEEKSAAGISLFINAFAFFIWAFFIAGKLF